MGHRAETARTDACRNIARTIELVLAPDHCNVTEIGTVQITALRTISNVEKRGKNQRLVDNFKAKCYK